jgi:hypothetical protein
MVEGLVMSEKAQVKTSQFCVACRTDIGGTLKKINHTRYFSPFSGSGEMFLIEKGKDPICYLCYAKKYLQDDFLAHLFSLPIHPTTNTVFVCPGSNQRSSFRVECFAGESPEEYCVYTLEGWITKIGNELKTVNHEDRFNTFECISCQMRFNSKQGIFSHFQRLVCNFD